VKDCLSHQIAVHSFFKSSRGTCALPPVLLDIGDDAVDASVIQVEVTSPQFFLSFHNFCNFFLIFFSWSKQIV
jgi:hypothetical protein